MNRTDLTHRLFPLAALAAALVLTGCTVGPDYRRPSIGAPDAYRGAAPAAPAAAPDATGSPAAPSLADRSWWELLEDPVLHGLIDEALRNNHDLELAAWRLEEARAQLGIAGAERFPAVEGEAGWSRSRPSVAAFPGARATTLDLYDVRVGVSWEVDLWGRVRRLNEAARARYLATEEARRGVLVSLVADVATTYFRLRALDEQLETTRRTALAFRETQELFDSRFEAGTASALETSSAAAALATTESAIPDLKRRIAAEENRLAFLLGRNPGAIARGAEIADQAHPPAVPAGLPSALLQRRPDIRAAEQEMIAANAEVGVALAESFPAIRLTGAFGGVAPQLDALFDDGKTWSAGGGLLTPVFQGKRLANRREAARARFEQSRVAWERSVTNAFAEVSTALVAYGELADVEREQVRAVAAYRDAVDLAQERYRSGLSDYLEVLQAQRQLYPAENDLAQTRFERLQVLVGLYRALGGGWESSGPEAS